MFADSGESLFIFSIRFISYHYHVLSRSQSLRSPDGCNSNDSNTHPIRTLTESKAAHHAISSLFPTPITPSLNEPLVIQYEVKLQHGLECGGAYIKLLTEESSVDDEEKGLRAGEEYTDKTPFTIMFGPDKCGSTNKGELSSSPMYILSEITD